MASMEETEFEELKKKSAPPVDYFAQYGEEGRAASQALERDLTDAAARAAIDGRPNSTMEDLEEMSGGESAAPKAASVRPLPSLRLGRTSAPEVRRDSMGNVTVGGDTTQPFKPDETAGGVTYGYTPGGSRYVKSVAQAASQDGAPAYGTPEWAAARQAELQKERAQIGSVGGELAWAEKLGRMERAQRIKNAATAKDMLGQAMTLALGQLRNGKEVETVPGAAPGTTMRMGMVTGTALDRLNTATSALGLSRGAKITGITATQDHDKDGNPMDRPRFYIRYENADGKAHTTIRRYDEAAQFVRDAMKGKAAAGIEKDDKDYKAKVDAATKNVDWDFAHMAEWNDKDGNDALGYKNTYDYLQRKQAVDARNAAIEAENAKTKDLADKTRIEAVKVYADLQKQNGRAPTAAELLSKLPKEAIGALFPPKAKLDKDGNPMSNADGSPVVEPYTADEVKKVMDSLGGREAGQQSGGVPSYLSAALAEIAGVSEPSPAAATQGGAKTPKWDAGDGTLTMPNGRVLNPGDKFVNENDGVEYIYGGKGPKDFTRAKNPAPAAQTVASVPAQANYGLRNDGKTYKGTGWLGELPLVKDGKRVGVASEYTTQSEAVKVNGKRIDFPSLVPGLSNEQITRMTTDIIPNNKPVPEDIMLIAIDHAKMRLKNGQSVFANDGRAPAQNARPAATRVDTPERNLNAMLLSRLREAYPDATEGDIQSGEYDSALSEIAGQMNEPAMTEHVSKLLAQHKEAGESRRRAEEEERRAEEEKRKRGGGIRAAQSLSNLVKNYRGGIM